jgi:1-deoxy-D-xylulose-5-phosphate synthase
MAAPRDEATLREELREAVEVDDAPTLIRYPKGAVGPNIPALERVGDLDVLVRNGAEDVLLVSVGALAGTCQQIADRLGAQGLGVTVVDPRWVMPLDPALGDLAARHRFVVSVEDNSRAGGVGSALAVLLLDRNISVPLRIFGLPAAFLEHGKRDQVLAACGLTAQEISRAIVEHMAELDERTATAQDPADR